jgi:hypothetical protein
MGNVTDAHELKGLQVQLAKETAASRVAKDELDIAKRKFDQSNAICKSLKARIAALEALATQKEPIVSEHALLRYLERVEGVNLDAIRQKILGEGTGDSISFARTGRIKKKNVTLIVKDCVVVTVE